MGSLCSYAMEARSWLVIALLHLFRIRIASADCETDQDQTDYFLQNGACGVTCKTIGVKGRSIGYDDEEVFPSEAFGIYSRFGNANARTKYTKAGGWMIKYGCVCSYNGDKDAWFVTNNEDRSGALLLSDYRELCPSDTKNWWARENPSSDWKTTGQALIFGKPRKKGDGVQFVCNPTNEAELEPPKQHKENPQAGGANFLNFKLTTLMILSLSAYWI